MDQRTELPTAAIARERVPPNSMPRDAATLILLDRSAREPKVLLGRRHRGHVFMPGKFVFPGGRVEPGDRLMASASALDPRVEARLMRQSRKSSPAKARGLALAALRETFEETGYLVGALEAGTPLPAGRQWADITAGGPVPDLSCLHFVARAVTPPRRPRRFDTRFFAVDAERIVHRVEGIVGPQSELVELTWLPIEEAKRLDTPAVTTVVLEALEARIAAGFGHDLPAPFYRMQHRRFVRQLL